MLDKVLQWLAWKLPRKLAYWTAIRLFVFGTTGKYSDTEVPSLSIADTLKRWEEKGEEENE